MVKWSRLTTLFVHALSSSTNNEGLILFMVMGWWRPFRIDPRSIRMALVAEGAPVMGAFRSRGLGSVIQLPIQRLADQADGIGHFLKGVDPQFHLAIAPAAEAGHVLGQATWVVQV